MTSRAGRDARTPFEGSAAAGLDDDRLPRIGELVDGFRLEAVIGSGGSSVVYRAAQLALGCRPVALKVLHPSVATRATVERFRRESQLTASLRHPSLAEVHAFGEHQGLVYCAMRLVDGHSLARELDALAASRQRREPAPPATRVVSWIVDVARALTAVHARQLVHRDVKPANIVLEPADPADASSPTTAVLVDFGIARDLAQATSTFTAEGAGTWPYAPREQVLGKAFGLSVDARSDVFSLGTTLHDLLARRKPDQRLPASAGLEPLHELVPTIDPELDAVVQRAVEPEPRWRYADAREFLDDLERWLAGQPTRRAHRGTRERVERWVVGHRRSLAAGFLGVVTIATAAWIGLLVHDSWNRAERAETAITEGDLLTLDRLLQDDGTLDGVILPDELLAMRAALSAPPDAHGLASVIERLRMDDVAGALFEAATAIRLSGWGHDRVIERFLLRHTGDSGPIDATASWAVQLLARLAVERPPSTLDEVGTLSAPHATLRAVWSRADLPRRDRMFAVSAFGGFGLPADLPALCAWASAPDASPEERRLGCSVIERLLRRWNGSFGADDLDEQALVALLAPVIGFVQAQSPWRFDPAIPAVWNTLLWPVRSARGAGRPIDLSAQVDLSPSADLACWEQDLARDFRWLFTGLRLQASLATPAFAQWAQSEAGRVDSGNQVFSLGQLLGWADDAALTDRVRATLHRRLAAEARAPWTAEDFDGGLRATADLIAGRVDPTAPDSDTLLGADGDETPTELITQRRALDGPLAWWGFREPTAVVGGLARSIVLVGIQHLAAPEASAHHWMLRAGRFGRSRVELGFQAEEALGSRVLRIEHQDATRGLLPHQGSVYVTVTLDETTLADAVLVDQPDAGALELRLPGNLLGPGQHTLSVALHRWTTTTYRLFQAEIL